MPLSYLHPALIELPLSIIPTPIHLAHRKQKIAELWGFLFLLLEPHNNDQLPRYPCGDY